MTPNMLDVVAAGRNCHVTRSYMLEVITGRSTWHNPSWHVMTSYMTGRWKHLTHSQRPFIKRKFSVSLQSTTLDLITPLLPETSIFIPTTFYVFITGAFVCLRCRDIDWFQSPAPWLLLLPSPLLLSGLFSQMLLFFSRSARPAPPGYKISLIIATL